LEAGGLFPKKGMEVCCSSASYQLGGMNTNDQQTSNTLMKTCADQFLSWSQSLSLIWSRLTFFSLIQKHCQFNLMGEANEKQDYPKAKKVIRPKP
jgi:hypothetical protein